MTTRNASARASGGDGLRSTVVTYDAHWWLFCLAIVVLKFLLLALDSAPKLYLGDSISYIQTALSGWIPDDRSYFYGFVIRWVALWTGSLRSLVVVQALLGGIVAIVVAWICRAAFLCTNSIAYLCGFLCAIDPLEMTWERYVMTETVSLFFYALVLHQSFVYLRRQRVSTLVLIQFLSVVTTGFRMVFLIPFQVLALVLPLIAFASARDNQEAPSHRPAWLQFLRRKLFWQHLGASLLAFFLFDQAYQHAYGALTHRGPAHLHASGYVLLALCAPILQPSDATDPRLARIIEQGDEFGLRNFDLRNNQLFIAGYLVRRWRSAEPDRTRASDIARQTALNAVRRDPASFIGFGARTYVILLREMKRFARWDLNPDGKLKDAQVKFLAERFRWTGRADVGSEPPTIVQKYYVAATPWFYLPLLSPLFAGAVLFIARNKADAWLLLVHSTTVLGTTFLFSTGPFTRYLQPLSLLSLLLLALALSSAMTNGAIKWRTD